MEALNEMKMTYGRWTGDDNAARFLDWGKFNKEFTYAILKDYYYADLNLEKSSIT